MSTCRGYSRGQLTDEMRASLERCDAEIREIQERPDVCSGEAPAWLVVLGIEDWIQERELLERERQS